MNKMNSKTKVFTVLRIVFSLILFFMLLWLARENLTKIWELLSSTNMVFYILGTVFFLSTIGLLAWRLKILLSAQGADFTLKDIFYLNLIGQFFTNFMPTTIGGDVVKGLFISQKLKSKVSSYAAILVDRIVGMFSLSLIAGLALIIGRKSIEQRFIFWAVGLFLLVCLATFILLFNKKLSGKIIKIFGLVRISQMLKIEAAANRAYQAVNIYENHKDKVLRSFLISVTAHFITFSSVYILAHSLSVYVPFSKVLLMMPIIIVLCMLPVTMNGLGLREWAFVLFFRSSMGSAAALSLSLLYLSMFLVISVFGGLAYLFRR
ncbi:MAG: flippase-like domain-containing protein [Candidatus Omnitrophica bacterium]|nr:flippase-like domain-containing protein [Candidatus Omnitrophota bacterium]